MALQYQQIPISFGGGIDTGTDEKQVVPAKLLDLQNGIFQYKNSISKRWGYDALGTSILGTATVINRCAAINAFQNELMLFNGDRAFSYSQANDAWITRGSVVSIVQSNNQIIRNDNQQLSPDFGAMDGIEVFAWEDSRGGIRYSVLDSTTNTYLLTDQPIYTGAPSTLIRPKVLPFTGADKIAVLFTDGYQTLSCVLIDPANPTTLNTSATTLSTSLATSHTFYDACIDNDLLYVAAYDATHVRAYSFTTSLTLSATTTFGTFSTIPLGVINILPDTNHNIWITYADNGTNSPTATTTIYASNLASVVLAPMRVVDTSAIGAIQSIALVPFSGNTMTIYAEIEDFSFPQSYNNIIMSNALDVGGIIERTPSDCIVFARSVGLASKPFTYNGVIYVNVAYESELQSTYFTLDYSGNVVGKINPGLGGGLIISSDFVLPECQQVSTGVFKYPNLVKGAIISEGQTLFSLLGVNSTSLDFFNSNQFLSATINSGLYIVGGILQSYDGAQIVEHGFNVYPEIFNHSPGDSSFTITSTGGHLTDGYYQYAVCYSWTDNNGDVQWSTPSVAQTIQIANSTITSKVSIILPTLRLTKKNNVQIVVFRTTSNGILFYRTSSRVLPIYNDMTVNQIVFVDKTSDTTLISNDLMYTQPNTSGANPVLANTAPPSCSLIKSYNDRLFIAGLEDKNQLWYTKTRSQGLPMEFSDFLTLQIDPKGEGITALEVMDDKLIIFKKSQIFYIVGKGPTNTGDQNDFDSPILITTDVGCSEPNSVTFTPAGIFFKSLKGIYLLTRGNEVIYKGKEVQAYNDLTITSTTLVPAQWVIFTTTEGTALVYDYLFDQWATFTNHSAIDSDIFLGSDNLFVFAQGNGTVYRQNHTSFSDNGTFIPLSLTTSWLSFAGLQGFQRVRKVFILGEYKGAHSLNVSTGYDFDDDFIGFSTIDTSPAVTDRIYQFRADLKRQRCQSLRIKIEDSQVSANEGYSISAITLEVGIKVGPNKIAQNKQTPNT